MSSPTPPLHSGLKPALGYAAYLGTSWTWVIGMLFPALILRDYGLWGFVAFAIPNVVGAAAMGFVLTPRRAKALLENHKTACAWFSVVTMAFHLFVVAWLLPALLGQWSVGIVVLTVGACIVAKKLWGTKGIWIASGLVWLLSMAMFAKGSQTAGAWTGANWEAGRLGKDGLLAFIPASALGFALCPYLDLTFLKARAETEKNTGRAAFALGFGVVFCAMIFFTACYGGQLWNFFAGNPDAQLASAWKGILVAHLPVQIGLTLAWHGMELSTGHASKGRPKSAIPLGGSFGTTVQRYAGILCLLSAVLGLVSSGYDRLKWGGAQLFPNLPTATEYYISTGESIYRSFLLLYGTVLPAYVLLKMIPTRAPVSARFRTLIFTFASLLSYPLAWGVFVLHHHWLILPCAGALTLAFLAVQFGPKAQTQDAAV